MLKPLPFYAFAQAMFKFFSANAHHNNAAINDADWLALCRWPLLAGFSPDALLRLRAQTAWFLQHTAISPLGDFTLSDTQRLQLAVQAALPTFELGVEAFAGWKGCALFPAAFRVRDLQREMLDGHLEIAYEDSTLLSGQVSEHGPVLLSWEDAEISPWLDGWNVVIHELAHTLDALNGDANGCPPLHSGMSFDTWKAVFSDAFADLQAIADSDEESEFDLYAATDPAECFAVCSEYFFELPHVLQAHYPEVYQQLQFFYRQDPASRLPKIHYRPVLPEMRYIVEKAFI